MKSISQLIRDFLDWPSCKCYECLMIEQLMDDIKFNDIYLGETIIEEPECPIADTTPTKHKDLPKPTDQDFWSQHSSGKPSNGL